jgi:hypothetical protein
MALFLGMVNARRITAAVFGASPALGRFVFIDEKALRCVVGDRLLGSMLDVMEFCRMRLKDGAWGSWSYCLFRKFFFNPMELFVRVQ